MNSSATGRNSIVDMSVLGEAAASEIQPVSSMEARESKLATTVKTEDKTDSEIETNDSKTITDEAGQTEQQHEEVIESTSRKKLEPDSEGDITSMASEKALKTTESTVSGALQAGSDGNSPFSREKVMEDGYNWRKYGQKLVKGNEFVRSYYRCTHPNCTAKKQLERSQGGQIVDIVYFGKHDHPRPLGSNSATSAAFPINEHKQNDLLTSGGSKAKSSGSVLLTTHHQTEPTETRPALQVSVIPMADDVKPAVLQSSRMKDETDKDETSGSKRRKKEAGSIERSPIERSTSESRVVVHTQTIFDSVNDGYRWRKYGQKSVKGSPHPRSYYRCSSPGCPVKKHVERSSHDVKLLITTYEGKHDHEMPPGRVVTHNADSGIDKVNHKELSPKGRDANKTPQSSAAPEASLREQLDSSRLKSELASTNGVGIKPDPGVVLDSQPNRQSKGESDQTRDNDEAASHAKSVTDSEDKATIVCHESSVNNFEGQEQKPKAEPVQS